MGLQGVAAQHERSRKQLQGRFAKLSRPPRASVPHFVMEFDLASNTDVQAFARDVLSRMGRLHETAIFTCYVEPGKPVAFRWLPGARFHSRALIAVSACAVPCF